MTADIAEFDTLSDGARVAVITLNAQGTIARILTLGATLQDFRLPGVPHSLTLGCDKAAAYAGPMRYAGAIVGPVANRIGGARARIGGVLHHMRPNEGANILHGGDIGLHAMIWQIDEAGADFVTLSRHLADGVDGLPGSRRIRVRYAVSARALNIELNATTDADTLMNLAPHPYWNLDGATDIAGHELRIAASHYLPTTSERLPTGARVPVDSSAFDLRFGRRLAPPEGFDHNFCLSDRPVACRPVAWLTGRQGIGMTLETTAPGLQVFDGGGFSSGGFAGHGGTPYGPHAGIALEPQFWPDAPNHPAFPSILLRAAGEFAQMTRFSFDRAG